MKISDRIVNPFFEMIEQITESEDKTKEELQNLSLHEIEATELLETDIINHENIYNKINDVFRD